MENLNEDEWSKEDYFRGTTLANVVVVFLGMLIFLGVMVLVATPTEGSDNNTVIHRGQPILVPSEWPTQVIYDTTNACYQGTVRWLMLYNPQLQGIVPPIQIQRAMVEHCFCVLDVIRLEMTFPEYVNILNQGDPGAIFMSRSFKCIREYGTLPGIAFVPDNSTTSDNSTIIEDLKEESQESPDQEETDSSKDSLIFQG